MPSGGLIVARATPASSRPGMSISPLLVDRAEQRLAGQVAAEVVAEQVGHALGVVGADAGHVWREDDVRQIEERAVRRQWPLREHVQRRSGDPALAEAS